MLQYLHLKDVGLSPDVRVDWAERINLIAGDNGLGKSFLLDLAWWALTRTWAGQVALPAPSSKKASIEYVVRGVAKAAEPVVSTFRRTDETWPLDAKRPPIPGIVVYIRIDGGFSVWDPARNYWRNDPGRPSAYHFQAADVWNGLDVKGQRVCEGLERDWVNWQEGRKPQFQALEEVLRVISPPSEPLRVGQPQRLFVGEGRDRPTLLVGNQTVPVTLASAGVRRMLALAYFLVWAWHEHRVAAQLLGKKPEDRFVILFDEPETHLHPRWQRSVLPSVLQAIDILRGKNGKPPQMLVATHAPLVAASLEPYFDPVKDDLIHLSLRDGRVEIDQGGWATQGDATNWLVSETFGLEQARSVEAERAIEAAEAFMRGDKPLPAGLDSQKAIHAQLKKLLPAGDEFWPRWLVKTNAIKVLRGDKG
ncbi:ATP-binding protein [Methyloversatilis sp. XJ19-49]|uniref:AAA family ATPase n=1 Tax=Methyloversatilis sp. XJ19-49 TaxID=2963429 RepID=UPI00211C562F|nr:ATP-binding protein [Methyloversatilis sp. XJ19-49]MCQ9377251.1 ATP-binding protein [Methyloversatilis sp. XJ19-49]